MGMYTELYLAVELRGDTPKDVIDALTLLTSSEDIAASNPIFPDRTVFFPLRSGGSYYFDAIETCAFQYDDNAEAWYLTFVTSIKNYENEWGTFLDWISPYIADDGHVGHLRYEESDLPTVLYMERGRILRIPVEKEPR